MDISKVVVQSFTDVLNNSKVLIPSIILFVIAAAIILIVAVLVLTSIGVSYLGLLSLIHNWSTQQPVLPTLVGLLYTVLSLTGVLVVTTLLVSIFVNGMVVAMADQISRKQPVDLNRAFNVAKAHYLSLFGAGMVVTVVMLLILGGAVLAAVVIFSLTHLVTSILLTLLIALVAIVLFVLASIYFYQVSTVIILEDRSAIDGIRRSFDIATRNFWDILVLLLLVFVIGLAAGFIEGIFGLIPIVGFIIIIIADIFVSVWFAVIPVYFYRDVISPVRQGRKRLK